MYFLCSNLKIQKPNAYHIYIFFFLPFVITVQEYPKITKGTKKLDFIICVLKSSLTNRYIIIIIIIFLHIVLWLK